MITECTNDVYTERIHSTYAHRMRSALVCIGHALHHDHGQRVVGQHQVMPSTHESVIDTVDQHDTMIHCSHDQGIKVP